MTSRLKPRRSVQRRYMRSSISAQSCDSVPPAPGWMVTMALLRSCSPPSIFLISPVSTPAANRRGRGRSRLRRPRPVRAIRRARPDRRSRLAQPVAAARRPARDGGGAAAPSAPRPGPSRNRRPRCAPRAGSAPRCGRAASKIAPQIGGALAAGPGSGGSVLREGWPRYVWTACDRLTGGVAPQPRTTRERAHGERCPGERISDCSVERARRRAAGRRRRAGARTDARRATDAAVRDRRCR